MYQWWVFVHLIGVFAFLSAHGVSMTVSFRLRTERDPQRVNELLQLSGSATQALYISLLVLVGGGVVAGFTGHWWSDGWIWGGIFALVLTTLAMWGLARPYYRRVRTVAAAKAEGGTSITDEQFDQVLRSGKSSAVMAIGVIGLVAILYFMVQKPFKATATAPAGGNGVAISARSLKFDSSVLTAPANATFTIVFDNADPGVPHNVSIYRSKNAPTAPLFKGEIVTGPRSVTYHVKALPPGDYFFRCDVHPTLMTGTLVVK